MPKSSLIIFPFPQIGLPEGKRKLAQIEALFHANGHFLDCKVNSAAVNTGGKRGNKGEATGEEAADGAVEDNVPAATSAAVAVAAVPVVGEFVFCGVM